MKKILLVDDHAPTRLMFSQILAQQDASYHILEASNGREACETALNQSQGGNYIFRRWQRHCRCKHQCIGSSL